MHLGPQRAIAVGEDHDHTVRLRQLQSLPDGPDIVLRLEVDDLLHHTPTGGAIVPRFGGKVIVIDAGMNAIYGSNRAVLLLEGGSAYAIHRGQKIALPTDTGAGFLAYLKKALSLEPPGSTLAKYVAEVEAALASGR